MRRWLFGLLVLGSVTTGVAFIYWPAALIVAGVLALVLELVT